MAVLVLDEAARVRNESMERPRTTPAREFRRTGTKRGTPVRVGVVADAEARAETHAENGGTRVQRMPPNRSFGSTPAGTPVQHTSVWWDVEVSAPVDPRTGAVDGDLGFVPRERAPVRLSPAPF